MKYIKLIQASIVVTAYSLATLATQAENKMVDSTLTTETAKTNTSSGIITNGNRHINPFTGHEIAVEEKERFVSKQRVDNQVIEEQIRQKELYHKYDILDLKKAAEIANIKSAIKSSNRDLSDTGNSNNFYSNEFSARKQSKGKKKGTGKDYKESSGDNLDNDFYAMRNTPPVSTGMNIPLALMPSTTAPMQPLTPQLQEVVVTTPIIETIENGPSVLGVIKKKGKWQALVEFKNKVATVAQGDKVNDEFIVEEVQANKVKINGKTTKIERKTSKLQVEKASVNKNSNNNNDTGGFSQNTQAQQTSEIPQSLIIPGLR